MYKLNKIYNVDCMEALEKIPDKSVDMILTDVPYKQFLQGGGIRKQRGNYDKIRAYGSVPDIDYHLFFEICLKKLKQINFLTFCNKETKLDFILMAKEKGFGYKELSFCKTSPAPFANNQWLPDIEYAIHIFKDLKVLGNYKTKRSFWIMPNFKEKNIPHPTPKKVSVVRDIIKNTTNAGDLILDPFIGSGTTGAAALLENRNFLGFEINADYCDYANKRILDLTEQTEIFKTK